MAWWRSARHAGLATAVLAFACLSLSFTGMLGGMGMPREEGVELLAAAGDFGRVVAAREMAEAAAQERSFVAKIDQVRMVKDSLSSQIVGHDMRSVMSSGGRARLSHLRELASDADRIRKLSVGLSPVEEAAADGSVGAGCEDKHSQMCGAELCCTFWARNGECHASNKEWMHAECTSSCSLCAKPMVLARRPHPRNRRVPQPTGLAWPKPSAALPSPPASSSSSSSELAASRAAPSSPRGAARPAVSSREERSRVPESVEISLELHHVAPGALDRSQIEDAVRDAVASVGHGLTARDVVVDSIEPVGAKGEAKTQAGAARVALLRQHVFGREMQAQAQDSFFHPGGRRLLEEKGGKEGAGGAGMDITLHVLLPAGVDRDQVVAALKAKLRGSLERELGRRGIAPTKRKVEVKRVMHRAASPPKQDASFVRWAVKNLLGGIGGSSSQLAQAAAAASPSRLAAANVGASKGAESEGHKASGLERVDPRPLSEHAWPFPDVTHAEAYGASRDGGLELLPGQETEEERERRELEQEQPKWTFVDEAKPVQTMTRPVSHLTRSTREGDKYKSSEAEGGQEGAAVVQVKEGPGGDEEEGDGEYEDTTGWHFKSELPPPPIEKVEVPEEECGPACMEGRRRAEEEAREEARKKVVIAREHVIEDATTLKHLLDAVGEEEELLKERKEESEEKEAAGKKAEEEEKAAEQEDHEEEKEEQDKDEGGVDVPKMLPTTATGDASSSLPSSSPATQGTSASTKGGEEGDEDERREEGVVPSGSDSGQGAADSGSDQGAADSGSDQGAADSGSDQGAADSGSDKAAEGDAVSAMRRRVQALASSAAAGEGEEGKHSQGGGGEEGAAGAKQQRLSASMSAVPPGFERKFPDWDGHIKPVPPTQEWDAVEAAKAYAVKSEAEIERDRAVAMAEGRRQARVTKEAERLKASESKGGKVKPVNVHVAANIDSARGLSHVPEWYRKQLAERKASGADKNAFSLHLGINVRSPQLAPEAEEVGGGEEEEGKEEKEQEEARQAEEQGEEGQEGAVAAKDVTSTQGLARARGLGARVSGLAQRLDGEEADVGRTMDKIWKLAGSF